MKFTRRQAAGALYRRAGSRPGQCADRRALPARAPRSPCRVGRSGRCRHYRRLRPRFRRAAQTRQHPPGRYGLSRRATATWSGIAGASRSSFLRDTGISTWWRTWCAKLTPRESRSTPGSIDFYESQNGAAFREHPEWAQLNAEGKPTNSEKLLDNDKLPVARLSQHLDVPRAAARIYRSMAAAADRGIGLRLTPSTASITIMSATAAMSRPTATASAITA